MMSKISQNTVWTYGLLISFALLCLYSSTDLDIHLAFWFYDPTSATFPYKNSWWSTLLLHDGLRLLVGFVFLSIVLAQWRPYGWYRYMDRGERLYLLIATLLCLLVVSGLKKLGLHGCPWDLQAFGGERPNIGLFVNVPLGALRGYCFPAGHASGGFALLGFYFALLRTQPTLARHAFFYVIVLGSLMGFAQQIRGAHFFSHTLWTIWICMFLTYLLHRLRLVLFHNN